MSQESNSGFHGHNVMYYHCTTHTDGISGRDTNQNTRDSNQFIFVATTRIKVHHSAGLTRSMASTEYGEGEGSDDPIIHGLAALRAEINAALGSRPAPLIFKRMDEIERLVQVREDNTGAHLRELERRNKVLETHVASKDEKIRSMFSMAAMHAMRVSEMAETCVKETNGPRCVVCKDGAVEVLLLPCQHVCVCSRCSTRLRRVTPDQTRSETKCPVCARDVDRQVVFSMCEYV